MVRHHEALKQVRVTLTFYGGELDGLTVQDPATVKNYARRAELSLCIVMLCIYVSP